MRSTFTTNIAPYVEAELALAASAPDPARAFAHLENAHVLGQASTYWHVRVHWLMLRWGWRERVVREVVGQVLRIVGAATKTAVGLVPAGNTGGANVSPFRRMPLRPEHAETLRRARAPAR